jgi:hypothetical protein
MRFGYSLTFPILDNRWFQKIFLPACLLLVPVLGLLVVLGWACEVCRRVVGGASEELPPLDFERNLSDGIRIAGILVIYVLPVLVAVMVGGGLVSPFFLSEKDAAAGGVAAVMCALECGILLLSMGDALLATAAIGRYASGEIFGRAIRPADSFRLLRSAPAAYLMTLLAFFPLTLLAFSGGLICLVGAFFTGAYAAASAFHLIGQAYLAARSRRGAAGTLAAEK